MCVVNHKSTIISLLVYGTIYIYISYYGILYSYGILWPEMPMKKVIITVFFYGIIHIYIYIEIVNHRSTIISL